MDGMIHQDKRIWDYLDGTLTETERVSFERDLEEDKELQIMFAKTKAVHEVLLSDMLVEAPLDLESKVLNRIKGSRGGNYVIAPGKFWSIMIFFAGLIAITAFVLLQSSVSASYNYELIPNGELNLTMYGGIALAVFVLFLMEFGINRNDYSWPSVPI